MPDDKPSPAELQARQELENAGRLGNDEAARAARKRLEAMGAKLDEAATERSAATRKASPPQDRRTPGKQQA